MANNRSAAIVSAVVGSVAAFIACFVFFYFIYKPAQPTDLRPLNQESPAPEPTFPEITPDPEIKPDDVKSVSIRTVYTGYFDRANKCSKSYNEYFGDKGGGLRSESSPCTLQMTFFRDGRATRSIEIRQWDGETKGFRTIEKSDSTAKVTAQQFDALAQAIVTNGSFRGWVEGTMINVSNCSVTVVHSGGTKTPMSNVDENTTGFLPMINAFKQLEKQVDWKTA